MADAHEEVVLSAILTYGSRALDAIEEQRLEPRHMGRRAHRALLEAAAILRDRQDPITEISLIDTAGASTGDALKAALLHETTLSECAYAARELVAAAVRRDSENAIRAAHGFLREGDAPRDVVSDLIEALTEIVDPRGSGLTTMAEAIPRVLRQLREGGAPTIPTGLTHLDEQTDGGLRGGELTIVGAGTSTGKSAFAGGVADHVSLTAGPVAIWSMEMRADALAKRALSRRAGVSLRSGAGLSEHDPRWPAIVQAAGDLEQSAVLFADRPGATLADIRTSCRGLQRRDGLALVVVDYLQLMRVGKAERRDLALGEITGGLKELAMELDVPVMCLSQFSREASKRNGGKPQLSDLRDSGAIEQDADNVWLLWRPDRHGIQGGEALRGLARLEVAKQREGPCGRVWLRFNDDCARFEDLEKREWPDNQQ
jgi:replicative DNA helicase